MFCFYNALSIVKLDNQFITHVPVLAFNVLINLEEHLRFKIHIIFNIILK